MHISRITGKSMSTPIRSAIGKYRHQVFVQSLQWKLPAQCEAGLEQDEFDVPEAVHLLAKSADGSLVGYARLLPTMHPYLLGTHFSHLIEGGRAPRCPRVWELSRYTATDVSCGSSASAQTRVGKRLLLEATRLAAGEGAQQLIFCTSVAIERLACRWGVDIERMGAAQHDGNEWLVAARIHCSDRTTGALVERPLPPPAPWKFNDQAEPAFA